jgi:hypothetical protein
MANDQIAGRQSIESSWSKIWSYVKSRPAEVKRSIAVPPGRVSDSGDVTTPFQPKKQYFAVVINEMFLEQSRQWWTEYDPMALIVSEFTYDGKRITVPSVVGPSLIQAKMEQVPNGMAITDTLVSGIHPYVGGKFALTVILARVKRQSHAKDLLQIVETVGHAFPEGAALEPYLKLAGALMDGVEALFGLKDTVPIVGHRWEYNDGISPWLEPGFFSLIDTDVKSISEDQLTIRKGRLFENAGGNTAEFRRADFLLYSLRVIEARNDVDELPFYALYHKALHAAASTEEGSWDRAKATLVALYQEMLLSPDLTFAQAQQLAAKFKTQLLDTNKLAKDLVLGDGKASITLDGGAFEGDDRMERLQTLGGIQELLKL